MDDEKLTPHERIVRQIMRAFPVPAWTQGQVDLWAEMLEDLDPITMARAAHEWISSRRERPAIADIRKAVAELQHQNLAGGKLFLPVDEAWAYVNRSFGTVGRYREFPDEHPLVKRAVDAMGWREMCASDNVDVVRGQFRKLYGELLARALAQSAASEGAIMPTPSSGAVLPDRTPKQLEVPRG